MAKLSAFEINVTRAETGVWLNYADDLWFRIARMDQPFHATVAKLQEPHMRGRRDLASIPDSVAAAIGCKAVCRHLLTDWANMDDEDDEALISAESRDQLERDEQLLYRDTWCAADLDENGDLRWGPADTPAGVVDAQTEPRFARILRFSAATAEKLLSRPEVKPVAEWILAQSRLERHYSQQQFAADSGN